MGSTPRSVNRIRVATDGGVTIVTFLDDALVEPGLVRELGDELCSLVDDLGCTRVILDCSNVGYMASAALNKLIIFQKKVDSAHGRLVLCRLAPPVAEVLTVTRLNQKFRIENSLESAKQSV
jgi:anti-sigma B factor antagonist